MEEDVWDPARHDQEYRDARKNERHQEDKEYDPTQTTSVVVLGRNGRTAKTHHGRFLGTAADRAQPPVLTIPPAPDEALAELAKRIDKPEAKQPPFLC
jgi:hypothetical protein